MKTFTILNLTTGESLKKTQLTTPKVKGFTVVSSERVVPSRNRAGGRLFRDANNRPYYAAVDGNGSHRQP